MELTFSLTTLYVKCAFPTFLRRFCGEVGHRWRSYQVLIGEDWYPQRKDQVKLPSAIVRDDYGVFFCRNQKMDRWWENHGFQPMANGEGPFGIGFTPQKDVVLGIQPPPAWADRQVELNLELIGGSYIIAASNLLSLELMTPGPPGTSEFSTWIAKCAINAALGKPRRPQ